jgi:hypothetical protein
MSYCTTSRGLFKLSAHQPLGVARKEYDAVEDGIYCNGYGAIFTYKERKCDMVYSRPCPLQHVRASAPWTALEVEKNEVVILGKTINHLGAIAPFENSLFFAALYLTHCC